MALINCPECGQNVSDKAKKCPQCGYPICDIVICTECNTIITDNAKICPECGCPVENKGKVEEEETNPQQQPHQLFWEEDDEFDYMKENKPKAKHSGLWVFCVLIGISCFYMFSNGFFISGAMWIAATIITCPLVGKEAISGKTRVIVAIVLLLVSTMFYN